MHREYSSGCIAVLIAWATLFAGTGAAEARTYVPNCGNPSYLDYKPTYWSSGCTGGSVNVDPVQWRRWTGRLATAAGTAKLRYPCGDSPCYEADVYEAPARLKFSRTRRCKLPSGKRVRYFARARVTVKYGDDNPFGYAAGWRTFPTFKMDAYEGKCKFASS